MNLFTRRTFGLAFATLLVMLAVPLSAEQARELRIGYQKGGVLLVVKQQGVL